MTITEAQRVPISRPLSTLSRFQRTAPAASVGRLAPFLAPATEADSAPALRHSDRGAQAMHRLRHPFASE